MRYRVWCETISFEELVAPAVINLLHSYQIDALVAVRPWQLTAAVETFARLRSTGVYVAAWPMIADEDGRWASTHSMTKFVAFAEQVVDVLHPQEIVIDLEPAFDRMKNWKALRAAPKGEVHEVKQYQRAQRDLSSAIRRWRSNVPGLRVSTAVIPVVAFDPSWRWGKIAQRILGTPVDELDVESHSVMAYSSLLEGWSRGFVDRRRAEWLVKQCATRARKKWGIRGAMSLGTVAPGAFGDEPSYRDPRELSRDVIIARTSGIPEVSLFDLGGIMRSASPHAWFDALTAS
jgi:hypothetical protein